MQSPPACFPYRADYSKLGIGVPGAVFLSQAVAWFNTEGKFTRTHVEWELATGLSYMQQKSVRQKLVEMNVLQEVWADMPRRIYYSLNITELNRALSGAQATV